MTEEKAEKIAEKEDEFCLEGAFGQIEKLLEKLGDREVSLEESFVLYEEGMKLLKRCGERIDCVEKQMLQIDGEGRLSEFS